MKILISGGAGFVASHIIDALLKKKHKVFFIDDFSSGRPENLQQHSENKLIETAHNTEDGGVQPVDVYDVGTLNRLFKYAKPRTIIHLAAQPSLGNSWNNPRDDAVTNILGTLAMLNMAIKYKANRFIFASTSAVYAENNKERTVGILAKSNGEQVHYMDIPHIGEGFETKPTSPYGLSKMVAESYVRMFFPNHIIFRLGNVYGPRQIPLGENQLIPRAIQHMLNVNESEIKGEGEHTRDFIYVKDVVKGFVKAMKTTKYGTYNLSTGHSEKVTGVLSTLKDIAGWEGDWAEGVHDDPRLHVRLDNSKYMETFKVKEFTPLEEGLEATFLWWKERKQEAMSELQEKLEVMQPKPKEAKE